MNKKAGFEYDRMKLKQLHKANKSTRILFQVAMIFFILLSGISSLYAYSIDPVLAIISVAMMLGNLTIMVVLLYVFGKLVFILRVLAGEEV